MCESWKRKQILQLDTCGTRIGTKYLDKHFFLKKGIISIDNVPKKIKIISLDNFPKDIKIKISILS